MLKAEKFCVIGVCLFFIFVIYVEVNNCLYKTENVEKFIYADAEEIKKKIGRKTCKKALIISGIHRILSTRSSSPCKALMSQKVKIDALG